MNINGVRTQGVTNIYASNGARKITSKTPLAAGSFWAIFLASDHNDICIHPTV